MNLVIDIGNTNIKIAIFKNNEILHISKVPNFDNIFLQHLQGMYYEITNVIVSSVRKNNFDILKLLNDKFDEKNVIEQNFETLIPITNCYKSPQTLGNDRLAAVVGANKFFPNEDILVVDAGTAITFDFIDRNANYLGGNISPGMLMRFRALNYFTNKLPLLEPVDDYRMLGNTTESAIISGIEKGLIYEIDGYIDELKNQYPKLVVILTGGDSFFFDKKLKNTIFAESNLVLSGLNAILNYNINRRK